MWSLLEGRSPSNGVNRTGGGGKLKASLPIGVDRAWGRWNTGEN